MKKLLVLSSIIILLLAVLPNTSYAAAQAVINPPETLEEGVALTFTADGSTGDEYGWKIDDGNYKEGTSSYEVTFNDNGDHVIYLKVNDTATSTTDEAQLSFSVVNAAPKNLQQTGYNQISPNVYQMNVQFKDTGINDTHQYKVVWQTGTIIDWTDLPYEETDVHSFSFTRQYNDFESVTLTVYVRDNDGGQTSGNVGFWLMNHAPEITSFDCPENTFAGTQINLQATFEDPNTNQHSCRITIEWGDGDTFYATTEEGSFSKKHTYDAPGTYSGFFRANDTYDDTLKERRNFTVEVFYQKPTFIIEPTYYTEAGKVFTLDLPFSAGGDTYGVSINWGDDSQLTTYDTTTKRVEQDHEYENPGTYQVNVLVGDSIMTRELNAQVIVKPLPPTQIHYNSLITSWDPIPGKEYTVYFSDNQGTTFHIMGMSSTGYMVDSGDPDGYDDIPGNEDDRPAPSDSIIRLYKVE